MYAFLAGIATVVDFLVLFLLTDFIHIWYLISSVVSYTCGMGTNYTLNKYLNFKNTSKKIIPQIGLFAAVALVGLGLNQILLFFLVEYFGLWYMLAKVISVSIVMIWSFFGHKKITFSLIK